MITNPIRPIHLELHSSLGDLVRKARQWWTDSGLVKNQPKQLRMIISRFSISYILHMNMKLTKEFKVVFLQGHPYKVSMRTLIKDHRTAVTIIGTRYYKWFWQPAQLRRLLLQPMTCLYRRVVKAPSVNQTKVCQSVQRPSHSRWGKPLSVQVKSYEQVGCCLCLSFFGDFGCIK